MAALDAHSIIIEELSRVDGQKKDVKNRVMILCPFHDERTPSCGVVVAEDSKYELGSFNCLGCGKHGKWNDLATKLGLQTIGRLVAKKGSIMTHGLKTKMSELSSSMLSNKGANLEQMMISLGSPAYIPWPTESEWREYPGWLVRNLGGYVAVGGSKGRINEVQCFLPVIVSNETVGMIKALTQKVEGKLSYISSDGDWVKERGLFPYQFVKQMLSNMKGKRYVFLVEGPRDAMRLIMNGIPALAVLGSQNVCKTKLKIVDRLEPDYVFTLPDNDKAGRSMAEKIKWHTENYTFGFELEQFDLPRDKDKEGKLIKMDPDNMPNKILRELVDVIRDMGCRRLKQEKLKTLTTVMK